MIPDELISSAIPLFSLPCAVVFSENSNILSNVVSGGVLLFLIQKENVIFVPIGTEVLTLIP